MIEPAPPRVVVGVLTVHPASVAATRLRALQYAERVVEDGVELLHWSFLGEGALRCWFGRRQLGRLLAVVACLPRLVGAVACIVRSDVVVVQREALPFGPPVLEAVACALRPVVWDVDDAIWTAFASPTAGRVPRWVRATGDKYRWVCRHADEVWAGSEVLAAWCREGNPATHVLPTVVDVPADLPSRPGGRTVTWVGSHSTGPFLEQVAPALTAISPPVDLRVVGASPAIAGLPATVRPWSLEEEAAALRDARVGVYPIDTRHPLADGKCGLKAILYMSQGIPSVATPTPTNVAVLRDGVEGLHAHDAAGWTNAVTRLLDDDDLYEEIRRAAHARALSEYSVARWAPWWSSRVRSLARKTRV